MDRLQLAGRLLDTLESAGVDYIHWKSNEHLDASLLGDTDFDLLVPPEQMETFEAVVAELGFVALVAPPERKTPNVWAFLGSDAQTGDLILLDVTCALTVGERLLKNYVLEVEDWLMDGSTSLHGVKIPTAEKEMAVLYIRSMLKTGRRQLLRSRIRGDSPLPPRIRRELAWLAQRTDPARLAEVSAGSGLPISAQDLTEFRERVVGGALDLAYVSSRRSSLRRDLRDRERLPRHKAVTKKTWLRFRTGRMMTRMGLGMPRRSLGRRGPMVAVVGADGSGKSRLTRDLESWLGARMLVQHLYFGQPKSGFWFKLLNKPGSLAREGRGGAALAALSPYTDALKWMMLARRRRRMAFRARDSAARGTVVIAERFPLPDFHDMETPMDGPRLQGDADCPAAWAHYEQRQYDLIGQPDLLMVLDTDLETLRARKLDLGVEEHRAKVRAVSALSPAPGRLIVDAGQPYEGVLMQAKTATWEAIAAAH